MRIHFRFHPPAILNPSNQRPPARPAARQIARSAGWSIENLKRPCKNGTYRARPRKQRAPPDTHHRAGFGEASVEEMGRDQERLANIRPRLAMTRVVKQRARASLSPC